MIETLQELLQFTKVFNQTAPVFKALIGDAARVETVVPVGQYATHADINSGAIANIVEYERRLARFMVRMLRVDQAQGEYLDMILNDYFGVGRPLAYTDLSYYLYAKNRVMSHKESAVSLVAMLQPFSSQPVLIIESGDSRQTMYSDNSFADWHPYTHDSVTTLPVTPDFLGGDISEGSQNYYFRVRLQPNDAVSEKIIVALLKLSHVAGVAYDIEYYSAFP